MTRPKPARSKKKKLCFVFLAMFSGVLLTEIMLRVLSAMSPKIAAASSVTKIPKTIDDPRLGLRPNPAWPDHDRKGFRNASYPRSATIVALGDSQTYGTGGPRENAWPQQIQRLCGIQTYNMSFGGYGPAHYLILLDEALPLKPKLIIEAISTGNDLYDTYSLIYDKGQLPFLKTVKQSARDRIEELEKIDPFSEKVTKLFRFLLQTRHRTAGLGEKISKFCVNHSKCAELLVKLKHAIIKKSYHTSQQDWQRLKKLAEGSEGALAVIDVNHMKTILTPTYRLSALNLNDPRIKEGLRMSLEAIRRTYERCRDSHVGFIVFLMPTKEYVFEKFVRKHEMKMPADYEALIRNEALMLKTCKAYFRKHGIRFTESLPALRRCIDRDDNPYHSDWDGHPNAAGLRAIAKSLCDLIADQNLLAASPEPVTPSRNE